MISLKNILVPTDFSENSFPAFEFAHYLSKQCTAVLHVLHVYEPVASKKYNNNHFVEQRFEDSRFLNAEEELRRFINKISPQGVEIVEAMTPGKPYEQILNYSRINQIDLVIISSHGWTGLSHLITGNVANKVLRYSQVPTICIKSGKLALHKDIPEASNSFAENWVG